MSPLQKSSYSDGDYPDSCVLYNLNKLEYLLFCLPEQQVLLFEATQQSPQEAGSYGAQVDYPDSCVPFTYK